MNDNNDNLALARLLFPDVKRTVSDLEELFPPRKLKEGAKVTRFAPSPTGFMHTGNLFSAYISRLAASASDGIFMLRIEDTDQKRKVDGAVEAILSSLEAFGMKIDEGVTASGEKGEYGPYFQSMRADIYHVCAKYLVENGFAYPCFCSAEQAAADRERQSELKMTPGYYGEFAHCRNLSLDEISKRINNGDPYVLRLRSPGNEEKKVFFDDVIRGRIEMPENTIDHVLLKSDGIPTYHFAHVVDDHFMRTSVVVRGDEWISSAPLHLQLFSLMGFKPPKYAHISPLMKTENGGKRKLSKRKDPEAAVTYYFEQGYPAESVREYLLTLANSNFEDWRRANKTADSSLFPFSFKKMSPSGALFDLVKFEDVSKNIISGMSCDEVYSKICSWAEKYNPEFYSLITRNPEFSKAIFAIDRGGAKPRKDMAKWSDAVNYTEYFFFSPERFDYPENIDKSDIKAILKAYAGVYSPDDDRDKWFEGVKSICEGLGFSPDVKAYKASPDSFKGHVGDVSSVIRVAITGRRNTPDLCSIMKLLGSDEVQRRLSSASEGL